MKNEPIEITIKVTRVLQSLNIPYLIGGSLASTLYGMIRTTQDSDIVALMGIEHIEPFVTALQNEFYVDHEMIAGAIQHNSSFNLIHLEKLFKVDVFIPKSRPFLNAQIQNAREQTFSLDEDLRAKFASPEDTILAKLEWYRLGGETSERQWRDVLGIIKVQDDLLNLPYLHHWAAELNITDLLERILQEK